MAFVLEDGTGLTTSNALISVAFADTYFTDRGNTVWPDLDTEVKQAAIIRATDYLNNRFTFLGQKFKEDQALEFPRVYEAYGPALMPVKMQQAVAQYANRAVTTVLAPDPTTDATGGRVVEKTEEVGPLKESTRYAEGVSTVIFKPYPEADMLLRGLTNNAKRVIR